MFETFGFFINFSGNLINYVEGRFPSIVLHLMAGILCGYFSRTKYSVLLFFVVVILHTLFNCLI